MSDFTAKMHQIRFRLRLLPDPAGGAYTASQGGELTALPQTPYSWWEGVGCPSPKTPSPVSALWVSIFGFLFLNTRPFRPRYFVPRL